MKNSIPALFVAWLFVASLSGCSASPILPPEDAQAANPTDASRIAPPDLSRNVEPPDLALPARDLAVVDLAVRDLAVRDMASGGNPTVVATIKVTRSTNSPEVDVAVYSDASAQRTIQGAPMLQMPMSYPAGSPAVVQLLNDLQAAGDVSMIPIGHCAKSASFGTYTTISAEGHTSGDLQCLQGANAAQTALAHDCAVLSGT